MWILRRMLFLSIDERGDQALDRTQPGLPMKKPMQHHDARHIRNGTTTLFTPSTCWTARSSAGACSSIDIRVHPLLNAVGSRAGRQDRPCHRGRYDTNIPRFVNGWSVIRVGRSISLPPPRRGSPSKVISPS
jgi:hypothetical protein